MPEQIAASRPARGCASSYSAGWLRQEENKYLSVPPEILRELDPQLLRLIDYQRGAYGRGYIDDMRDPIAAIRPDLAGLPGFGDEARDAARVMLTKLTEPVGRNRVISRAENGSCFAYPPCQTKPR